MKVIFPRWASLITDVLGNKQPSINHSLADAQKRQQVWL